MNDRQQDQEGLADKAKPQHPLLQIFPSSLFTKACTIFFQALSNFLVHFLTLKKGIFDPFDFQDQGYITLYGRLADNTNSDVNTIITFAGFVCYVNHRFAKM